MSKKFNDCPLISVGIPVYNGAQHIGMALDALLEQKHTNLEIIISDNQSTDETLEICRKYAAKDNRIKVFQNKENIGAVKNFNRVFQLAQGEYFMWHSHDDALDPQYLQKCLLSLQDHPEAVLCSSDVMYIDGNGWKLKLHENMNTVGQSLSERIFTVVGCRFWSEACGLMRTEKLKKTSLLTDTYGSDVVLLTELAFWGGFAKVKEPLFYYRDRARPMKEYQTYLNAPNQNRFNKRPYTELLRNVLNVVKDSDLDPIQKSAIYDGIVQTVAYLNLNWYSNIIKENLPANHTVSGKNDIILYNLIDGDIEAAQLATGLQNGINNVLNKLVNDRPILIWGASAGGCNVLNYLKESGCKVSGFIDNNPAKWGEIVKGIQIFPPSVLSECVNKSKPYVIIASMYAEEIQKQIRMDGYEHERDFKQQDCMSNYLFLY
ncbi:s-adenosyl-l-methionine-dependent methyltransferase [Lucifera butyrica]|uniref:S-adenosyl-l-methionine-dependent methyltransferase n=1 Tax=Lucifera butyrica TaxID=1351585 RepID=A0A498R2X2_9FIRM|nr:glycosyltransferase family A protein [Lucifera butyrica]VBB05519.1 s-adenosyl-l-methionine-dependent methyltransferase [Lucifera butyrica]